jgi:hypothetical protein
MLRGEFMKNYVGSLIALTLLFGLSVAAKAEGQPGTIVKLPFAFVVRGKILPAGTYTASQLSFDRRGALKITNRATGKSVLVVPNEVEDAATFMPHVTFQQVGEQHFLRAIQSADNVYNIPVSPSEIMEAAAKPHDPGSMSGHAGGN